MTFDVSKFLALTGLLASASIVSAACSSTDDDDGSGGSGGTAGKSSGGSASAGKSGSGDGGVGAAANEAGAGNSGGSGEGGAQGNEGGLGGLGGAAGGAEAGGAGAGGGGSGECLPHDPSYEDDPCLEVPDLKCDGADEGARNPFYDSCQALYRANINAQVAYVQCLEGKDECATDSAEVAADCWSQVAARTCPVEGAADVCTTVVGTCSTGLSQSKCVDMLDTAAELDTSYLASCMDPAGEFYDDTLEGDCTTRLAACAGVLPL